MGKVHIDLNICGDSWTNIKIFLKNSFCISSNNEYITTYGTQKIFFEKYTIVYNTMMCCKN